MVNHNKIREKIKNAISNATAETYNEFFKKIENEKEIEDHRKYFNRYIRIYQEFDNNIESDFFKLQSTYLCFGTIEHKYKNNFITSDNNNIYFEIVFDKNKIYTKKSINSHSNAA